MEGLSSNLMLGFNTTVTLQNLLFCFIGVFAGTLVGVLPGIGPVAAIAMLLPTTFYLPPVSAIIMLAGLFYGTQYGGSTTSILVNLPGESSSVITCLDGYQMAKKGRAGPALAIAAIGSFTAGTFSTMLIAFAGPPLANVTLEFSAPEYFSLMTMGLIGSAVLAQGPLLKAIAMIFLGLILGMVGTDVNTGVQRFTFGATGLADGLSIVGLAMGMFGFAEILVNLERGYDTSGRDLLTKKIDHLYPSAKDLKESIGAILRGTAVGSFLGLLPGAGPVLSSFTSYAIEKKIAKHPEEFGQGAIQGVAGPESANNGAAQSTFIPMLTLGIPSTGAMALMLGALMIHNIAPGPEVISKHPDLFWGLIVSMWIGNAMLLFLNLPLIGFWVKLLQVPYRYLFPTILAMMAIGVYSVSNQREDIYLMILFGLLGYVFKKLKCEPAPLILAFVLGPMIEENLRRALLLSQGDPMIFLRRPISAAFLTAGLLILFFMILPAVRKRREEVVEK